MQWLVAALICAFSSGVLAQEAPHRLLSEAFASWRGITPIKITIEGTEFFGVQKRTFGTEIWYQAAEGRVYFEVDSKVNGLAAHRVVADGERIWIYDERKKTYASAEYTTGKQALNAAVANTNGHAGIAITLLADLLTAPEARWMMPAASREVVVKPNVLEDPIWGKDRVFRPEADEAYIVQSDGRTPTRAAIYHLRHTPNGWTLESVFGAEQTPGDKLARQTVWSLAIDRLPESFSRDFKFSPPKGATAIAMPAIRRGG